MDSQDKYLKMLESPKADTRYDACEQLRVSKESSEKVILALEKTLQDNNAEVADAAKRALKADVHQQMLNQMGRPVIRTEEEIQEEIESKAFASIIMVSTPSLENYTVTEYLGIVSSEVVLGTGLLSELGAGIADMFGTRSTKFQNKLKDAKSVAMNELRKRAHELHANAILSVDLDYSVLESNILMVVANGTAVKVETITTNNKNTKPN